MQYQGYDWSNSTKKRDRPSSPPLNKIDKPSTSLMILGGPRHLKHLPHFPVALHVPDVIPLPGHHKRVHRHLPAQPRREASRSVRAAACSQCRPFVMPGLLMLILTCPLFYCYRMHCFRSDPRASPEPKTTA